MNNLSKIHKKLVVLLVLLMLLIGSTVGGTLAWILAQTDPLENTFVAGNIEIELLDNFTSDGKMTIGEVEYDTKKLMPGDSYPKAPRVKVLEGSAQCYVRLFTIVWWDEAYDSNIGGMESTEWFDGGEITADNHPAFVVEHVDETNNKRLGHVFEVVYLDPVDASVGDVTLPAPYTKINIPLGLDTYRYDVLKGVQVTVLAQAVQAEGFDSAAEAFAEAGYPDVVIPLRENTTYWTLEKLITYIDTKGVEGGPPREQLRKEHG